MNGCSDCGTHGKPDSYDICRLMLKEDGSIVSSDSGGHDVWSCSRAILNQETKILDSHDETTAAKQPC